MNEINWQEIQTSSGFAGHIPEAISKLTSTNAEIRRSAYWDIDNYAILQSDLYESAFYIIDPIVEILQWDYTVDRQYPIRLLNEVALGGNGTKEFMFPGLGLKSISNACIEKFKSLKDKIFNIEIRTEEESIELSELVIFLKTL